MSAKGPYIGVSVPRREDDRLLRGQGMFLDDIAEPAGTLFAAFVRSPYPHAAIRSIDKSAAEALPGVVAVITGKEIAQWTKPMTTPTQPDWPGMVRPNMAVEVVRHVGETVAVVVARSAYLAEDGAELVEVDYSPLPAVVSIADAETPGATRVHDYLPDNIVFRRTHATAGTDEAFARADHVVSDTFWSTRLAAVPMETRGFLATFDRGRGKLTFWSPTQVPHKLRSELAECLDLPEMHVRVITPDVGGGFGLKAQVYPEDIVGAALARHFGGTVKWVQDRQEDLIASTHARDYRFEVELAVNNDGMIAGLRARIAVNLGAYSTTTASAGIESAGAGVFMVGPYKLKYYAYDCCSVVSHKAPVGVYRGVAAPVCAFAVETLIERVSKRLRIDPVEFRRRNLVKPQDLPYPNAIGVTYDTASHEECLDRALKLSRYYDFKCETSGQRGADGKLRGIGLVCMTEHTGQGSSRMRARGQASRTPGFDGASIRMEPDGKVIGYVSHATQGQGHLTVFAQLIAECLGLDIADVTVEEGDTSLAPYGTGTVASRAAVSGGGAVVRASEKIAIKLRRIAGHVLEASPEDIILREGRASIIGVPSRSVTIRKLAELAYLIAPEKMVAGEEFGLEAIDFYDPPTGSYSNATHVACVAVDDKLGQIAVERYFVVHDCGRIINPMIVDGQVQGGVAQGLGATLMEAMEYSDEGQPLTTTLLDYVLPTALDVPPMEIEHIETPSTTTVMGIKGAGEGGAIGSVPVICIAVADALAKFNPVITRVPLTPSAVFDLISAAQELSEVGW
jgi:aerobic carbon-monoxide dehydrogenase large subunit